MRKFFFLSFFVTVISEIITIIMENTISNWKEDIIWVTQITSFWGPFHTHLDDSHQFTTFCPICAWHTSPAKLTILGWCRIPSLSQMCQSVARCWGDSPWKQNTEMHELPLSQGSISPTLVVQFIPAQPCTVPSLSGSTCSTILDTHLLPSFLPAELFLCSLHLGAFFSAKTRVSRNPSLPHSPYQSFMPAL